MSHAINIKQTSSALCKGLVFDYDGEFDSLIICSHGSIRNMQRVETIENCHDTLVDKLTL